MNIKFLGKQLAGLSLLVLTVSACATSTGGATGSSMGSSAAATANAGQPVNTLSKSEQYQLAVQESARLNGVDVRWVNPPDEGDLAHYDLAESPSETKAASN